MKNYTSVRINEQVLNATGFNLYIKYKTPYTKVHKYDPKYPKFKTKYNYFMMLETRIAVTHG